MAKKWIYKIKDNYLPLIRPKLKFMTTIRMSIHFNPDRVTINQVRQIWWTTIIRKQVRCKN